MRSILLVDDDKLAHFLNERLLRGMNISGDIHTASNGAEALDLILGMICNKEPVPSTIFLDLQMPVMGGHEFLLKLQSLNLIQRFNIRVVILSSSIDEEIRRIAHTCGVSEFCDKPLEVGDIHRIFSSATNSIVPES